MGINAFHGFLAFLFLASLAGCGENPNVSLQPSGGAASTATPAATSWSAFGVTTATSTSAKSAVSHADYLAGSHSAFTCDNCHSIPTTDPVTGAASFVSRAQICASCHPFSKYTSVMTNADHTALNTGTHCNACHYSASGVSGSAVSGWRWSSAASPRTRIPHTQWHYNVKGVCLNCHTSANETIPSAHPSITATTACESCHHYDGGKWAGAHTKATTGCRATGCHPLTGQTSHYSPYNCEWCHTGVAAGGYVSWALSLDKSSHRSSFDQRACSACHGGGGFGD